MTAEALIAVLLLVLFYFWLSRRQKPEYSQVDALNALRPLIQQPRRHRQERLFLFKWRLAQDLERRRR